MKIKAHVYEEQLHLSSAKKHEWNFTDDEDSCFRESAQHNLLVMACDLYCCLPLYNLLKSSVFDFLACCLRRNFEVVSRFTFL